MPLFEEGLARHAQRYDNEFPFAVLCQVTEIRATFDPVRAFGDKYGSPICPKIRSRPTSPLSWCRAIFFVTTAADWSDVSRVVMEIQEIRDAVNSMFGNLAKATLSQKKAALRRTVLSSESLLRELIEAVGAAAESMMRKPT